jgi:hypothetical protein
MASWRIPNPHSHKPLHSRTHAGPPTCASQGAFAPWNPREGLLGSPLIFQMPLLTKHSAPRCPWLSANHLVSSHPLNWQPVPSNWQPVPSNWQPVPSNWQPVPSNWQPVPLQLATCAPPIGNLSPPIGNLCLPIGKRPLPSPLGNQGDNCEEKREQNLHFGAYRGPRFFRDAPGKKGPLRGQSVQ